MKFSLKKRLLAGKPSIGTWVSIGHPDVTEILADIGFDWLLFDMEHAPLTIETIHRLMQAMNGSTTVPLVRVASKDPVGIGQVLDAGAHGVMVPQVNTVEDARRVVAACKYPPEGTRGVGPRRATGYGRTFQQYMKTANREVLVIVQIETPKAIENIDAILSVPGIDVAAIGPGDLAQAMGCFANRQRKDYQDALDRFLKACARHKVVPSMAYVSKIEAAKEFIARGFRFIGIGEDDEFLAGAATLALAKVGVR